MDGAGEAPTAAAGFAAWYRARAEAEAAARALRATVALAARGKPTDALDDSHSAVMVDSIDVWLAILDRSASSA